MMVMRMLRGISVESKIGAASDWIPWRRTAQGCLASDAKGVLSMEEGTSWEMER